MRPLLPWPALLAEEGRDGVLIVGDLHLGYERALARVGINIPSQTGRLLRRLLEVLREAKPSRLVIAGDVKHNIPSVSSQELRDVPEFFERVKAEVGVVDVVPGNHDGDLRELLPSGVNLWGSRGVLIGGKERVGIFHGHTWPSPQLLGARHLVMAHIHPMVQFRDPSGFRIVRQVWVKTPLDESLLAARVLESSRVRVGGDVDGVVYDRFGVRLGKMSLVVLPAFNDILGGIIVNRVGGFRCIGPVIRSGVARVGDGELFLLDGTFVGLASAPGLGGAGSPQDLSGGYEAGG